MNMEYAVKDGHTAADTTEVTETSEDALGESAKVLEHAYHDAVGNSATSTVASSTVVSEHAEWPPQGCYFIMNKGDENQTISEENDEVDSAQSEMTMEREMEFKTEIKCISNVQDLTQEQLQYMVDKSERHQQKIFGGYILCERHIAFKQGGRSKRELDLNSRICSYTDEQVDTVMQALENIFCKQDNKYLDYLLRVLLPEMLVKIHMDIHHTSHVVSEQIMAHDFHPTLFNTGI
ncbi:uncharacterized protein LOC128237955 [Mya arenaria]|uniref:uncharacterized protein LOC128237955 n=1 Tax=Mya arenaria TaxID=6604 RepID=UPI0022DE9E7A|nr:uncharacterized protein LOC128237955 [Mya arenaria]